MTPTFRILIAEAEGRWRESLVQALTDEGHHVRITVDLNEVYEALTSLPAMADALDVVIVAEQLNGQSGLDVIYRAWRKLTERHEPECDAPDALRFVPNVAVITTLHEDHELLDLLRKRGVVMFLDRSAALAQSVAIIGRLTYGRYRRAARFSVKWGVQLVRNEERWRGTMVDISTSGCQIVLGRKEQAEGLSTGQTLSLVLSHPMEEGQLSLKVTIRRMRQLKALFGSRTSLGVSFDETADHAAKIGELVDLAKALSSVFYRSSLDLR